MLQTRPTLSVGTISISTPIRGMAVLGGILMPKLMSVCLAIALAFATVSTSSQPAEARRNGAGIGLGIAAGIIAGAALGGYAYGAPSHYRHSRYYSSYDNGCYAGPRQCRRDGGYCDYNRFGDYVCRGGTVRCFRPTICD